jgi:gamma-aminobutyric acid type B receptor
LGKVAWAELPAYSAEAAYLIQALSISNTIMDKLLAELNTDTVWNVTCNWIRNNEKSWENWIRPSDYQEIPMGLQIAMWVLSGLCIAGTLFYLIVTIKYRKSKVIIAASGAFLVSMCIGGAFMFGSVMAFVSNTDIGCNVFIWMLPLGFALLFGSLFAKTGRIYLLFSNKSLQLVKYTDRDVGLCVGVILLLECVVLAVMTGLQPADYAFQTESEREFTFCLFHLPTGVTLLAFNGVVMVFGIIVSVLVSRLRLSLYNEAKYIGLAMYNFGFVVIFVVVIFLVNDLTVRYALLCCCILFITMVSLSVLFIPKIRLLFTYTEEELHEMNEAQLQAVIRSYTKKFASSSTDKKNSTNKTSTTGGGNSTRVGALGSSFEDEMVNLASTVKAMSEQIKDLKAENKKLRETTSDDYRSLYEKYYHESMILKNQLFEFKQRYNKVPTDKDAKPDSTD